MVSVGVGEEIIRDVQKNEKGEMREEDGEEEGRGEVMI
jgi:hypothetical protein